jgi:hypothetical protein
MTDQNSNFDFGPGNNRQDLAYEVNFFEFVAWCNDT